MNKLILSFAALLLGGLTASAGANVYASALAYSDGAITFILNDDATVVLNLLNEEGEIIETASIGECKKGVNKYILPPNFSVTPGNYKWSLTASSEANTEPVQLTQVEGEGVNTDLQVNGKGIAIDCNPESATFGTIYASIPAAIGDYAGKYTDKGIYLFNAALELQSQTPYTGGVTWSGASSPNSLAVSDNGDVFMCDWGDAHSGVWVMDAENPSSDFVSVFASGQNSNGLVKIDGVAVHGSVQDIALYGKGEAQILYTQDEDYTAGYNDILTYKIGDLNSPWAAAPSANWGYGKLFKGSNNIRICSDRRGGLWVSQRTDDNKNSLEREDAPTLQHINAKGEWDFQTGDAQIVQCSSQFPAVGVNADGSLLAITSRPSDGSYKNIVICSVEFDASDKPSLTKLYTVSYSEYGQRVFNLAFDAADNVYMMFNNNGVLGGIGAWALPKEKNEFTTPANMELVLKETSAIADVAAEGALIYRDGVIRSAVPAVVYTAAGVKVAEGTEIAADALAGGVYIVRAGSETLKIVR